MCGDFDYNLINEEILVRDHAATGERVFIPRIPFLQDSNEKNGCLFKQMQFPIKLSFAMTINKL